MRKLIAVVLAVGGLVTSAGAEQIEMVCLYQCRCERDVPDGEAMWVRDAIGTQGEYDYFIWNPTAEKGEVQVKYDDGSFSAVYDTREQDGFIYLPKELNLAGKTPVTFYYWTPYIGANFPLDDLGTYPLDVVSDNRSSNSARIVVVGANY